MKAIIEQLKKETKALLLDIGFSSGAKTIIGLDIGSDYFRASRIKKLGNEVSTKEKLVEKINNIKDLNKNMAILPEENIIIDFKGESLAIKRASVPLMPVEEIEEALKWELKEQVEFDIEKAKIKFDILRERESEDGSKKIELIAVVYKENEVEKKVKELRDLGLNIRSVIPSYFALSAYVSHENIVSPKECVAIVDIGSSSTAISIIEGGKVSFARTLPIGGDTITEAMTGILVSDQGRMELSKEEAEKIKREQGISKDVKILSMIRPFLERFAKEIKTSLEYHEYRFKCVSVKKVVLAGNSSKLKGLKEYLSKEIELEIIDTLPEFSESIGLALLSDSKMNIIPEKFKEEKKKTIKKISVRMASIIVCALFLTSYVLLLAKSVNLNKGVKVYKSHLGTIQDIKIIKDKIIILGSAINTVSNSAIEKGRIMKELSNLVRPSVMLDSLVIEDIGPNIRLSGIILKEEELSEFMAELENSPMIEKVKLILSERSEEALNFDITCDIVK